MNPLFPLRNRSLALGLVIFFLLNACQQKENKKLKIDPGFRNYIAAFTSGSVSRASGVKVILRNDFPGKIVPGSEVAEKLFRFSPEIKGKAFWIDQRTIEFRPEEPLESGQFYEARFSLSELMDVPAKFSTLVFQFEVINQNFSVETSGLELVDPVSAEFYNLKGKINSADVMDAVDAERLLEARFKGKKLNVVWTHEVDQKTHSFQIDSIKRTTAEETVLIEWNGKALDIDNKGEEKIQIPALDQFRVSRVKVFQDPEQYVAVYFSDPLDPNQNLQGLLRLDQLDNSRMDQEKNMVRIYPAERQSGVRILTIDPGVRNLKGDRLPKSFVTEISFEEVKPAVRLTGDGVILPQSDGLILPFEAVNLSRVDVTIVKIYENNVAQFLQVNNLNGNNELYRVGKKVHKETINLTQGTAVDFGKWNAYSIDLTRFVANDPGAIYQVTISFKKQYSLYNCTTGEGSDTRELEVFEEEEEDPDPEYYGYYYDVYDYYYPEDYNWRERDNPCHSSYYTREHYVVRNILASDLGIIAKGASKNTMTFAVSDLRTTEPVNDVELQVYSFQNQLIGSVKTINEGIATIQLKDKPFLLIAKKGKQRGYLRLDDGTSLSLSKFDVGGAATQKGLKGFIYGERGVWRPGDTLFIGFILEDKNKLLPAKFPLTFELYNPKNQLINRIVNHEGINGFYRFTVPTDAQAATGNWTANVRVGGAVFSKNLKIETIKPNRLKINLGFTDKVLSINKPISANLQVSWLTGAVARDLKARIKVNLSKDNSGFSQYPGFTFHDPLKSFSTEEQIIFESKIDDNGNARISSKLDVGDRSPGMLKAGFLTHVFEESGDFSSDFVSMSYAPYSSFVGIRPPKGDKYSGMLETDRLNTIEVVTLTPEGQPVSRKNLEVIVYKVNWRWWWNSSDNDLADYEGTREFEQVFNSTCTTNNGKGSFAFKVEYPEWGRYLIWVKDPESGHSTGVTCYIDWPYWRSRDRKDNNEAATMLNFSSDKSNYKVGEKAEITIPSGGHGRALVSLESGSKVLNAWWVEMKDKETRFSIPLTAEMAPNVYVHVTLVQPHAQTVNNLPIRLYGVIPLLVYDPLTKLEPQIQMPEVLRPEQTTTIRVSEKTGKAMTYTLAMVDEGLLDLTRFKTPDPWNSFYAREALGVKTWDLYDLVLGAWGGKLEGNFAIGGDENSPGKSPKSVNRFKPLVRFIGPFKLPKGGVAHHKISMPSYVGSVRTMVIAAQDGAYGNAEKTTPVRKPLMVLATLPRVLGPGETLNLPVTVFAMENHVRDVKISVSTNNQLILTGDKSKQLRFTRNGDQVVMFSLKVPDRPGIAKVKVMATSGKETAETEIEVEVRSPNPFVSETEEMITAPGKSWNLKYTLPGMPGTNTVVLQVSRNFDLDFSRRLTWLIQYPYGCAEQTTSAAFPQLFLDDITDVTPLYLNRIQKNMKAAIRRLQGFQNSNGGFSYWPGQVNNDDWTTSYVGHFLIMAERKGYVLPSGMKENWVKYQTLLAKNWSPKPNPNPNYYSGSDMMQAYRLYTLALAKSPALAAMNRLKEVSNLSGEARLRLAAAYALAGQTALARELSSNYKIRTTQEAEMEDTYGSPSRDMGMALETMVLLGDKVKAFHLAKEIASMIKSDTWMSTQSISHCLIGIAKYLSSEKPAGTKFSFSYSFNGGKMVTVSTPKSTWQLEVPVSAVKNGSLNLLNTGETVLYARLVMTGQPAIGELKAYEKNLKIECAYKDMKGNLINPSKIEQGMDFYAEVKVTNPGYYGVYRNLALSQIFPSGWEILNYRLHDLGTAIVTDVPDYQDIRDDRVNTFFGMPRLSSKQFIVLLHAAYPGRYYLPGPSCEGMYDNAISARKTGQWVEVIKDKP